MVRPVPHFYPTTVETLRLGTAGLEASRQGLASMRRQIDFSLKLISESHEVFRRVNSLIEGSPR